jgi:hypothetical protein
MLATLGFGEHRHLRGGGARAGRARDACEPEHVSAATDRVMPGSRVRHEQLHRDGGSRGLSFRMSLKQRRGVRCVLMS